MLKNILKVFLLILIISAAAPVFAKERIIDNAAVLSSGQKAALTNRIDSLSAQHNFDLVIVIESNIGNMVLPMDYADDFFDYNGYGAGQDRDGCLFLQVTDTRDYWISTSGRGIKILNNYAFNKLENDMLKYLSAGNNYEAYNTFLQTMEEFLVLDTTYGRSYNFFHQWNVVLVIIAWVIAFIIGLIVVAGWKSAMNTAVAKTQAAAYIVPGSLTFREKTDNFLYSTVTKTVRQTESSSKGGIHTSSSGRSHGGRGGKY